jgi:hypothetical protein
MGTTNLPSNPLTLAALHIAAKLGDPPAGCALVVASPPKAEIAKAIVHRLRRRVETHLLRLEHHVTGAQRWLPQMLQSLADEGWGLVLLCSPIHAELLFRAVGRPDTGLRIDATYLFCDWLIRPQSLIRIYAIDMDELRRFRDALLRRLEGATELRITSVAGTDIRLAPRHWESTDGEVFTAPVETETEGRIVIDGCIYDGPPNEPPTLDIDGGRASDLATLDIAHRQQCWLRDDLTRDENAAVIGEFGLGINPGALWDADLMEAEQARGTCHVGFGNNLPFGGANRSNIHVDVVLRHPTITADGNAGADPVVCQNGVYQF